MWKCTFIAFRADLLRIGGQMMMISGSYIISKQLLYFWCELLEKGWLARQAGRRR